MNTLPAFKKRTVVCHSDEKMFEVVEVEDSGVFMFAVCGRAGLYERIIKLEEAEIAALQESGEASLHALAAEIDQGRHEEREYLDQRKEIYKRA